MRTSSVLSMSLVVGLAACGGSSTTSTDAAEPDGPTLDAPVPDAPVPDAPPPDAAVPDAGPADARPDAMPPSADAGVLTGTYYHYVQSSMIIPSTPSEAVTVAHDLDGDPMNRPDNLFGSVLATLVAQGIEIQTVNDAAIADGTIVHLFSLRADDLVTDPLASWQVYLGEASPPPPDFSGSGAFAISIDSPADARVEGSITSGAFTGGAGPLSVEIVLYAGGPPVRFDLIGGRVTADVTATGCSSGKIGGGITQDQINTVFIPALAEMMNAIIAADPGCPAACGSTAQTLLDLFDHDGDGHFTAAELASDALLSAILAPDVDLLDSTGAFNPRVDGIEESVSIGLGFSCVGAVYTAPGEI